MHIVIYMKKTVKILISFIFLSLLLGCGQKESEEKETLTIGIIES